MRTLFAFFRRYSFFFIFLILEGLCFVLISNNPYHRTHIINTSNSLTGGMFSVFSSVEEYFYLKKANKILHEENTELRNYLDSFSGIHDTVLKAYHSNDSNYIYIPAKVINNSVNKRNNFIMIDKGENDSIEVDMGVISPRGIVGVVIETSNNYSTVLSLLHKDSRISAKIKKNDHLASLIWPGMNYREAELQDVPVHINLQKGDTIITSGFSFMFPEGIMVGSVKEYMRNTSSNFNEAIIDLNEDFNRLRFVYVIKHLDKQELERLSNPISNEQ